VKIADSTVLVTGANRGLGSALVEEALRRGAKRIYAGGRQPFVHADRRVVPLVLDVTDAAQIRAGVEKVVALNILVNNAGISLQNDLSDRAALERLLAVNLFGTYDVTQAFLPVLVRSRSAIVNILSLASIAAVPFDALYSISKAAAFSLSQSLRALLAGRGMSVHTVLAGPIDTDMTRNLDVPKASPERTARAIFAGVENEEEEIFPDPMSEAIAEGWRDGAVKALQRQFAAYVAQTPVKSKAAHPSIRG
jgi:NAD(P)-dependent dehydrogenase (short-subunit alcohol dehydrogenase family)